MKKILIIICFFIIVLICLKDDSVIIPADAIRFRVIANSNSINDQILKNNLAINLENYIMEVIDTSDAKNSLLNNYNRINNYIKEYFKTNNINQKYELLIGKNYFPKKEYKGINYDAGYYDSVVVKLGDNKGLNWWCVVYPPLCLIPEDTTNVEYTTIAKELIKNM